MVIFVLKPFSGHWVNIDWLLAINCLHIGWTEGGHRMDIGWTLGRNRTDKGLALGGTGPILRGHYSVDSIKHTVLLKVLLQIFHLVSIKNTV